MIIYNVTIGIDESIIQDWLNWMRNDHIPEILSTKIFTKAQINRVITNNDSGYTFAVSYSCNSMKDLHNYQVNYAPLLQQKHSKKFGDKVVSFRTIMEVIDVF
tara:strand:+ start:743 stop:1051 length:309 start_codon:yes stop_codon:yes gene_type:complete